jgi:cation transport ATPase
MPMKTSIDFDRLLRRSLVVIAVGGLAIGTAARLAGYGSLANQFWFAATVPVAVGLLYSIVRDIAAGRMGVDAIALVSMLGALGLGQPLAGAVIALMYSGGNVLEDFAVGRAERDLRALVDRAPRVAHRRLDHRVEDVPVAQIAVGDTLLVRAGEVIPVDGIVISSAAIIDESALTGEPLPAAKLRGASAYSGTLNAGETFELMASAIAGESTYAGIVRMVRWGGGQRRRRRHELPSRRSRADFVHLRLRQMRLLPQGHVFALHHRRLDPRQRDRRHAGRICAHPACRHEPLSYS